MTPRRGPAQGGLGDPQRGRHIPVLLSEVLEALRPRDGERYIDATFGAGGYTSAILDAAPCRVLAIDRDPSAIAAGGELVTARAGALELRQAPFGQILDWAQDPGSREQYAGQFDGVVFDLGVSSMQLDEADRGFSFQADGPLDMRMFSAPGRGTNEEGPSAADVVNTFDEAQIADILFQFGEERRSRAIARAITARRAEMPFTRTLELANLLAKVLGSGKPEGRHPATRTFQALRIFVNDELGQLLRGLAGAERVLKPGGRLVVVTFHSLEDRIVKRFFATRGGKADRGSRHLPQASGELRSPSFRIVNPRPLTSSKGETQVNPRARSARLRAGVRTPAEPWPVDFNDLGVPGLAK